MAEGPPIKTDSQLNTNEVLDKLNSVHLKDDTKVRFQCGIETFELTSEQLTKIPYLETLCSGNFKESPDEKGVVSIDPTICSPDFMKAIVQFIQTNRERRLFSSVPDYTKATDIFKLLDYLGIQKPKMTLEEIRNNLTNLTTWQDKTGCGETANRSKARDTSVILCWIGVDLVLGHKEQQKVDNFVFHVMSHPRTFYWSLRRLTFDWYLTSFEPTQQQISKLQGWLDRCDWKFPRSVDDGESSSGGSSSYDSYGGYSS